MSCIVNKLRKYVPLTIFFAVKPIVIYVIAFKLFFIDAGCEKVTGSSVALMLKEEIKCIYLFIGSVYLQGYYFIL